MVSFFCQTRSYFSLKCQCHEIADPCVQEKVCVRLCFPLTHETAKLKNDYLNTFYAQNKLFLEVLYGLKYFWKLLCIQFICDSFLCATVLGLLSSVQFSSIPLRTKNLYRTYDMSFTHKQNSAASPFVKYKLFIPVLCIYAQNFTLFKQLLY